MTRGATTPAMALGFALVATPAAASTPGPTEQIKAVFAKTNTASLCTGSTLQMGALIGEIAAAYKLNVFTLPSLPDGAGIAAPDTVEGRTAAWLVFRKQPNFKETGLKPGQADLLDDIGTDLTDYAIWLGANAKQPFAQAPGSDIPAIYAAPPERRAEMRTALLKRLLARFLTGTDARPVLQCAAAVTSTDGSTTPSGKGSGADDKSGITFAVRGKIEDLAIPSKGNGSDKFKGASSASFAFTDNYQKGESSVAIDATIAAGYQNSRIESLFAFVRYTQNSTETSKAGDDDDSKDVRALSPGIVYTRQATIGKAIYGTAGLTAYPTLDFAQHARTGRIRLFLDDITLRGLTTAPLCGGSDRVGGLEIACLAGVFVEGAHVWRAGTSTDLATLDDDQYLGFGGSLKLGLSLPAVDVLKSFSLTGEYRYMAIVSGALADPHRLSLALNYKLAERNLTFGIGYDVGSNFDTFQRERLTKVTFGFKY